MLPTGLERTAAGEVIKTPDREVQDRLTLIFQTMLQKSNRSESPTSCLRKQSISGLPRRDHYGETFSGGNQRPRVGSSIS